MNPPNKITGSYKTLEWNITDGILHLILSRPPENVMTSLFFSELQQVVARCTNAADIKGLVIYGKGRHFSSGADLNELTRSIKKEIKMDPGNNIVRFPESMFNNLGSYQSLSNLKIPVVAAIQGVCIGSAFELSLFCHFRISTPNAVMGLPESSYGLMPGLGGIQQLSRIVPKLKAMEVVFKGATFSGNEAFKYGMVDGLARKEELVNSAIKLVGISSDNYRQYNKKEYLHTWSLEYKKRMI